MKILILGGDGYLGWPTGMFLSKIGHEVSVLDNFSKRKIELEMGVLPIKPIPTLQNRVYLWNKNTKNKIKHYIGDLINHKFLYNTRSSLIAVEDRHISLLLICILYLLLLPGAP